ncbi:CPBP family intramembrane glutamic endopeptidase [Ammoniphilus sp. CFH 90114]|uniref:CPBP family intramembrane glutamic endopeptidase n=1 Tax=Ammoniphilus sp. CFH 90114 TaxID=2493665 RepID=UPI0013E9188B|nr:CPBP family intramembrane glutamic endopeptidase [Ammoniphilus sp. CFH 90114]
MDPRIQQMDDRLLLLNLYLTQIITLVIGVISYYFIYFRHGIPLASFFTQGKGWLFIVGWALSLGILILLIEVLLVYLLPPSYFDDGGINELLFCDRSLWHIVIIVAVVAFCEEFLFRLILQNQIGLWWTSVVFAIIHIRYLAKWVMFTTVFFVSMALGWLYELTGTIIAPMLTHFVVDLVLAYFIRFDVMKRML